MREKTSQIGEKYDFCGENFCGLIARAVLKDTTPPNFTEKTFTNSHKTLKFVKVFSLESFPLYGNRNIPKHHEVVVCTVSLHVL